MTKRGTSKYYNKICKNCSGTFHTKRNTTKFCSDSCRASFRYHNVLKGGGSIDPTIKPPSVELKDDPSEILELKEDSPEIVKMEGSSRYDQVNFESEIKSLDNLINELEEERYFVAITINTFPHLSLKQSQASKKVDEFTNKINILERRRTYLTKKVGKLFG